VSGRSLFIFFLVVPLLSCGNVAAEPLEKLAVGDDPGALDWRFPKDDVLSAFLDRWPGPRPADPIARALEQRDLWMMFERAARPEGDPHLAERLAALLRERLLTREEIRQLPDTVAASTGQVPSSFDPAKPDQSFLPPDLFSTEGPWVPLGSDLWFVAYQHRRFFRGHSVFLIYVRHPDGREATLDFVRGLIQNRGPRLPPGMEFALVRRCLLISDQGLPMASPIVESVQLRHLWGQKQEEQSFYKFELHRKDVRLHAVGPDEGKPAYALSFEHQGAELSHRYPTRSTCVFCHNYPNASGVQSLIANMTTDIKLRVGSVEEQEAKAIRLKQQDDGWKRLRQLWGN